MGFEHCLNLTISSANNFCCAMETCSEVIITKKKKMYFINLNTSSKDSGFVLLFIKIRMKR